MDRGVHNLQMHFHWTGIWQSLEAASFDGELSVCGGCFIGWGGWQSMEGFFLAEGPAVVRVGLAGQLGWYSVEAASKNKRDVSLRRQLG